MPDKYFQHWLLFVISLFNLLKNQISSKNNNQAENLLELFVKQIEDLYSDRKLSYNVHQLLHLGLCVRRWGSLWATSAFPFENYNGFLIDFVHVKKHLDQELVNNLIIARNIEILKDRTCKSNKNVPIQETKVYQLLTIIKNVYLSDNEYQVLISKGLHLQEIQFYSRIKINNIIYTSKAYKSIKTIIQYK